MTLVTLRPNGTVRAAVTVVGAASTHAATNDNSDASYILHPFPVGFPAAVDVGTVTLPAGSVTKQARARVRARSVNVGGIGDDLYLNAGIEPLPTVFYIDVETFAEYATAYAPVTLSQAQIDGLVVEVGETDEFAGAVRVAEIYVDLIYVSTPVVAVTAVTPDPYTLGTIIPIAWTNTLDTDGGPQTRRQVKVFTAAQYGVGGFDPETSPSTWDSGDAPTSALSTSTPPLVTGVTYRAYVKVAQTVNSVAHWSAWAFDQFSINVPVPVVAAVTAVADDALARIVVTVDRNTGFPTWDLVEVQRSIDGGTTWEYVRGARNIADTTDQFIAADYEVGNGAAVIYRARATDVNGSQTFTGAWVNSTSTSWSSTATWLKDPDLPDRNLRVRLAVVPQLTRPRPQVVHRVVNSPSSVVISDVLGKRVGTIVLLTTTLDEAAALETLLGQATLLLQTPDSHGVGSMYVTCGDVTPERVTRLITDPYRRWVIPVIEVLAPADPAAST